MPRGVSPAAAARLYVERLVILPGSFLVADHAGRAEFERRGRSAAPVAPTASRRPACALSSFSQPYKLERSTLELWADALRRSPGCELQLLNHRGRRSDEVLADELAGVGIARRRVAWLPVVPRAEHLRRAAASQLSLDTPGYNQGTSGLDALWARLPMLSLPLAQWCGTMGAGLLSAVGLADGRVPDARSYEDAAVALVARAPAAAPRREGEARTARRRKALPIRIEVAGSEREVVP